MELWEELLVLDNEDDAARDLDNEDDAACDLDDVDDPGGGIGVFADTAVGCPGTGSNVCAVEICL